MSSKIYEFNILDKYRTSNEDILRTVEQTLANEAALQGWAPGYTYEQASTPNHKQSGEIEYSFTVYGEFASSIGDDQSDATADGQGQRSVSAAKPAEL